VKAAKMAWEGDWTAGAVGGTSVSADARVQTAHVSRHPRTWDSEAASDPLAAAARVHLAAWPSE